MAYEHATMEMFKKVKDGLYAHRTLFIHGRDRSPRWDFNHHVVPPISSSAAYRLDASARGAQGFLEFADGDDPGTRQPIYIYDRLDEPVRGMLEERLAFAEGADVCVTFATGMAAIAASIATGVSVGDEVVADATLYGCTYSLLTTWMPRFGVKTRFIDLNDASALRAALSDRTRIVYCESPVNPTLRLVDLGQVAAILDERYRGADPAARPRLIVDNTFATPAGQRPLELGADVVVHSLTKNLCGFGTEMGGAVCARKDLEPQLLLYRKDFGGVLSPKVAWSILVHGLPTLEMRLKTQQESARAVARMLADHPRVARVMYPGLPEFPQFELARRQLVDYDGAFAPGNMVYFVLRGEPREALAAGRHMIDYVANRAYTITLAVSLGQIRTLIEHPASMTHAPIPPEQQTAMGIDPGGIRLSIGCEATADILRDLQEALT
jgi:cystathionine beta-lyase/cystathionine gamma-synthase